MKQLAFVIPLGAEPDQCYDGITPSDMYTSMTCAWSGAFLLAGALAGSMWSECVSVLSITLVLTIQSLHPRVQHASYRRLGYRPWSAILLHLTSGRVGSTRGTIRSCHQYIRSLVSIWQCLSHQSR
jgi:hypothetical protein